MEKAIESVENSSLHPEEIEIPWVDKVRNIPYSRSR
jgi:hypothetical protein